MKRRAAVAGVDDAFATVRVPAAARRSMCRQWHAVILCGARTGSHRPGRASYGDDGDRTSTRLRVSSARGTRLVKTHGCSDWDE